MYLAKVAIVLFALVFLLHLEQSKGRVLDPFELGKFSSSSDNFIQEKAKRRIYDSSCKGEYNRGRFSRLYRICDECYSLFQKPSIALNCRANCFQSSGFELCLEMLSYDVQEYKSMARELAVFK